MMHTTSLILGAAAAAALVGCTPPPAATKAAEVKDSLYTVTPASMTVKAGLLTGEMTDMKITERVEEGTGRVDAPPRLTGKLVLKNVSNDQTLRLLAANMVYVGMDGKPIPLEENRTAPSLKVSSSYGTQERLDPGQETTQNVEVEFPAEALKAKRLKEIRVDLQYIPSPYRQESLRFGVAVGEQPSLTSSAR